MGSLKRISNWISLCSLDLPSVLSQGTHRILRSRRGEIIFDISSRVKLKTFLLSQTNSVCWPESTPLGLTKKTKQKQGSNLKIVICALTVSHLIISNYTASTVHSNTVMSQWSTKNRMSKEKLRPRPFSHCVNYLGKPTKDCGGILRSPCLKVTVLWATCRKAQVRVGHFNCLFTSCSLQTFLKSWNRLWVHWNNDLLSLKSTRGRSRDIIVN